MKAKIHPKYRQINVKCACGNEFSVGSSAPKDSIEVEVCSNCHPFYTGKDKRMDKVGRVEKFKQKLAKAKQSKEKK